MRIDSLLRGPVISDLARTLLSLNGSEMRTVRRDLYAKSQRASFHNLRTPPSTALSQYKLLVGMHKKPQTRKTEMACQRQTAGQSKNWNGMSGTMKVGRPWDIGCAPVEARYLVKMQICVYERSH